MKTRPGVFVAAEDAHALHRDLKRLSLWIQSPGIGGPGAPHLVAPNGLLVGEDGVQVIGQKKPLQQITGAWMLAMVGLQAGDRPGREEHERVTAEHGLAAGLGKDSVLGRCGANCLSREHVPPPGPPLDEGFRVLATVVVDDQQLGVGQVLVESQRLQREVDAVEVVIRGHPDREFNHASHRGSCRATKES